MSNVKPITEEADLKVQARDADGAWCYVASDDMKNFILALRHQVLQIGRGLGGLPIDGRAETRKQTENLVARLKAIDSVIPLNDLLIATK